MKRRMLITIWFNRILLLVILGLFFMGYFFKTAESFFWSLLLSIPLGFFQVITAMNLSYSAKEDSIHLKRLKIYASSVGLYFLTGSIFVMISDYISFKTDIIEYTFFFIPIILAFFFTYIIEQVYKLNFKI